LGFFKKYNINKFILLIKINLFKITMKFVNIIISFSLMMSCAAADTTVKIKKSSLAGKWYSSNPSELAGEIDSLLGNNAQKADNTPLVLILPHAGYAYSGKIAAKGYSFLGNAREVNYEPEIVVLIGPSHYAGFHGCSILDVDFIETPLGKVKIARDIVNRLSADRLFSRDSSPFEQEHSIEIHLPFLQRIYRDKMAGAIQIIPILVGELDDAEAGRAARALTTALKGTRPLFIISTDFTHYGAGFRYEPFPYTDARTTAAGLQKLDTGAIDLIVKKDLPGFSVYCEKTGITICGRNPVRIAIALPIQDFRAKLAVYDTSGNMTGDFTRSVSYAAILFTGNLEGAGASAGTPAGLTREERRFLLNAARDNISSWLKKGSGIQISPADAPKSTLAKRGVFVTLKKRGSLRGCIGYLTGLKPLAMAVLDNSYNAAFRDPRFEPVAADEMKNITIEISVLTEPEAVRSADEITVGRDGLIIERGSNRGLLLPQVATEQGWDRNTFLDQTCVKAGLRPGAWKEADTKIMKFRAEVFGEDER
jgi:MEMO1 family protein